MVIESKLKQQAHCDKNVSEIFTGYYWAILSTSDTRTSAPRTLAIVSFPSANLSKYPSSTSPAPGIVSSPLLEYRDSWVCPSNYQLESISLNG